MNDDSNPHSSIEDRINRLFDELECSLADNQLLRQRCEKLERRIEQLNQQKEDEQKHKTKATLSPLVSDGDSDDKDIDLSRLLPG